MNRSRHYKIGKRPTQVCGLLNPEFGRGAQLSWAFDGTTFTQTLAASVDIDPDAAKRAFRWRRKHLRETGRSQRLTIKAARRVAS